MLKPTILVTAATGKTGAATTIELLARQYPVRAMVRQADARSRRLEKAGAHVVLGSLEDYADLQAAMSGVQRAYFCPPLEPGTLRRATLFATAAQAARLECIVFLSQWISDPLHPAVHSREKWLTGEILRQLPGLDTIAVQPGFFADNYFSALDTMLQFGVMPLPLGSGLNAPPSNEDIGRVIAALLIDPAPHIGNAYRPTGPRLLAPDEIAAICGRALGRKVKYQNAPIEMFQK